MNSSIISIINKNILTLTLHQKSSPTMDMYVFLAVRKIRQVKSIPHEIMYFIQRQKLLFRIYIYLNLNANRLQISSIFYLISVRPLFDTFTPHSLLPSWSYLKPPPNTSWDYTIHIRIFKPSAFFCCTFSTNLQQRITVKLYLLCFIIPSCWDLRGKKMILLHSLYAISGGTSKPSINIFTLLCVTSSPLTSINFQSFLPALYHIRSPPLNWVVEKRETEASRKEFP